MVGHVAKWLVWLKRSRCCVCLFYVSSESVESQLNNGGLVPFACVCTCMREGAWVYV